MHLGEQNSRAMSVGQVDLFGLSAARRTPRWRIGPRRSAWPGERETLGLFLSGHPITPYEPDLKFLVSARLADVGGPRPPPPVEGGAQLVGRQACHRRRAGSGDPPPAESRDPDSGRSQRPARGQPVRGGLSAASRHHRQGRDPDHRRHAALRRFHRGVAPAGQVLDGYRPGARALRAPPVAALARANSTVRRA